ncbi:MAG: LamG domain-containing protein [Colwellia sp.]|nr:LamG domain-containing protein [Colwellia sp.]
MLNRLVLSCGLLLLLVQNAFAAECLAVFPTGFQDLVPANEQLINFPANNSALTLTNNTTLPRGDNFYLNETLGNQANLYVGAATPSETTARLFFRTSVSWQNININESGNPEDLIIIIDGSLQITGGQTDINAIIYVKGTISVSGNPTINGAITSVGDSDSTNVGYNQSYINNADFDGMCDNLAGPSQPSCEVLFPGPGPLGSFGSIGSIDIKGSAECNGGNCSIENVTEEREPTIPDGGNDLGEFNRGSLSDTDYNFYNNWKSSRTSVSYDDSSGTAVIYIEANGDDVIIPEGTELNESGEPSEVLLVIKTNKKVEIGKDSIINAFIYIVAGDEVKINEDVEINGAITLITDKLTVEEGVELDYDSDDLEGFDPHGFCDTPPTSVPVILLADYHFDECIYTGVTFEVIDETGNYPASSFGGLTTFAEGQVERAAELSDADHHFETSIPLSTSFSISTWFKKPTASSGSQYFVLAAMAEGDELIYIDRNNNWTWGVYNASPSESSDGSYSFNALDNNWHHMVVIVDGGQTKLYIDGQLKDTISRATAGTLKYIATSFDAVSGSNAQSFRSPLDEFMVFDGVLTEAEITDIYTNQSANNNYDGSSRTPAECEGVVHYTLDELSWSGAAGEVIDAMGNLNGRSYNGANTSTQNSAIPGNPGTCAYGVFDGIDDYVQIEDNSLLDLEKELTIAVWINIDSIPSSGLKTIMSKDENYEFHVDSSGEIYWWWSTHNFRTSGLNIVPGTWYHVAVTYRSGQQIIYVNGVERAARTYTGNLVLNNDPLQIGQDQGYGGRYFNGDIDELVIFKRELTATEVVAVYNETRPCDVVLDHFELDTINGQGLTCQPKLINIKACANAACDIDYTTTVDVELSINGVPNRTVTVIGGNTDVSFSYTTADIAKLSLDQNFECLNGSPTACDVTFSDTGFQFLSNSSVGIPTQLSGKPSNIGYHSSTLELQAVTTSPITGACEAVLIDTNDIEFSAICSNPIACAGQKVTINNLISDMQIETINSGATASYSPSVSLDFGDDTDSTATFVFTYPDAGMVQLNARYNIRDENGDPTGVYMQGSSDIVIRPLGFYVNIAPDVDGDTTNPAAVNYDDDKFLKAGEDFDVIVKAVQWELEDDPSGVGVPLNNSNLKDNNVTPNFGNEILNEEAKLSHKLIKPSPGAEGSISAENFDSFTSGQSSLTLNYSEVGIIEFFVNIDSDNRYLGTEDVTGYVPFVGRFYPDHFEISDELNGDIRSVCQATLLPNTYTYIGEMDNASTPLGALRYGVEPGFTLTAKSSICLLGNCTTTTNYTGEFMKLLEEDVERVDPTADGTKPGTEFEDAPNETVKKKVALTAHISVGNLDEPAPNLGVVTYVYNEEDHYVYNHELNSQVDPFTSDLNLEILSIEDVDGVKALDYTSDDDLDFPDAILTLHPVGTNIRFGRWVMQDTYGPETSNISMKHFIEQYDGDNFEINIDEACIVPTITDKKTTGAIHSGGLDLFDYRLVDLDTLSAGDTNATVDDSAFIEGVFEAFVFSAPGSPNRGSLEVEYEVPSWLKFDWRNIDDDFDGPYTDNPTAIVTFGLFRGNDRIIYWREK